MSKFAEALLSKVFFEEDQVLRIADFCSISANSFVASNIRFVFCAIPGLYTIKKRDEIIHASNLFLINLV